MKNSSLKRVFSALTAFAVLVCTSGLAPLAAELEPQAASDAVATVYPTADIQFRKDSTNDFSATKGLEVRHKSAAGDNIFLGGLKFDLSGVDTTDIKKVTLELVTESRDNNGTYTIKPFSDDWGEGSGNKYTDKQAIIDAALSSAENVAEFTAAYGATKLFEAYKTDVANRKLENWTTSIDVTSYVNSLLGENKTTVSMLITPQALTNTKGATFLTKDASVAGYGNDKTTWNDEKDSTFTNGESISRYTSILRAFFKTETPTQEQENLLKPRLKIEYLSAAELPHPDTVTVSGPSRINSFGKTESYTYDAEIKSQFGTVMDDQSVTWSSTSSVTEGAVTVGSDGTLSVPENTPAQTVTITASCGSAASDPYTVTIVCEDERYPSEAALTGGVRMRGNGNTAVYDLYPNMHGSAAYGEVGMSGAYATAILQYDMSGALGSKDYISKLTLNVESADSGFARPLGVWLYEKASDDTRTDKTWSDADFTDTANRDKIKDNISLVMGIEDYKTSGGSGVAAGRSDYAAPIATGSATDMKYGIELTGEALASALDYAQKNSGVLTLVLSSSTASSASENRSRLYLTESGEHRGTYLSINYSMPDSIEISGDRSIDLDGIESFPASYKYTATVCNENGDPMSLKPTLSFKTTAASGAVSFDAATGTMTIPSDAAAQTVTITAEYGSITESIEVLIAKLVPSSVTIEGADTINSYISTAERKIEYKAKVLDQKGNVMEGKAVTWEFSTTAAQNAATFENGVVTVPAGVADQTLTIKAMCDGLSAVKTVKIEKKILDLPESFTAAHSMKLRGFGVEGANGEMKVDTETEEIGMKASAPALLSFDLTKVIPDASESITALKLNVYKESGTSIALGLWNYADPHDGQRTDGRTWKDADWTDTLNKSDICNNYSLIFGIDDFGKKHDILIANYAEGRTSYIDPISTASLEDNKYTFSITGDALQDVIAHAKANNNIAELVVTSADLDARSSSLKLYMCGIADKNEQYMPTLTVEYNLPSTPRKIDIAGNDTLYINNQAASYTAPYSAAVYDQNGKLYADQSVEWSADMGDVTGVSFDAATGTLTVTSGASEGVITITAKSAYAVGTKKVTLKKIPQEFRNGSFEDTDDSYLADGWTPNVPVYKLNFDETDFYNPWNESSTNDGGTLFSRTQGYALGKQDTGEVRGNSGIDSTVKFEYSSSLSDEDAETLMNSATQALGINNSKTEGFLTVGYEIPYYYMLDYYLTPESTQVLSSQGLYLGLEFRNKANTGFLASVATGERFMPFNKGQWRTYTGTLTTGTENQINGQARVNIGIKGMKGAGYIDYFRLIPKGVDTQRHYDGEKSMQVANSLTWTSDIFSVEQESYYTYQASARPESSVVDGQLTYTFMDNNYNVMGESVLTTDKGEWSAADEDGWKSIEGELKIPAGATICKITLSNPNKQGNVWFDGLVFTKTGEAKASSVRITGGGSEAVIPESGESAYQYTAVVYDQFNNVMSDEVSWTVTKADGTACPGVSISGGGVLKVSSSAAAGSIKVSVTAGGKTASKAVTLVKKGASGEPESTGKYGFNGSFAENDGSVPLGWTNEGSDVAHYTFDTGMESWKSTRTDYGAPMDGELRWDKDENHTDKASSGSLLIYNPSYNMPGAQIPNDVRIQGGMPYKFEMSFKQQNITDDSVVRAHLRYFNSTGGTIAETPNMLRYYPNDYSSEKDLNGWQRWSGTEVVPTNASTVRVELRYRGGLNNYDGYAWFDDIKVSKVTGIDKETTYNGHPSLMLVGYNEDKTVAGKEYGERWVSDKLTNISQGNTYEYSAMVKTFAADSGVYPAFIFYDGSGNEISTVKGDKLTGTSNLWTKAAGSVVAPAGAKSVAVAYCIDGKGTAWVTDVSFNAMSDSTVAGIEIDGADSVKIPISGSKSASYTVNCVNAAGNTVNAADTTITASNLPSGVSFKNGVLTVSKTAYAGTVKLSAEYGGFKTKINVSIIKSSDSSGGSGGSGGGGGGGGGGVSGTGGGTSSVGKPASPGGAPMGNVDYSGDSAASDTQSGSESTASVPTLLQAPSIDYFTGGTGAEVFEDIVGVPWAKQAIETLYKAGVVNGRGDNKFVPDDSVTRAEFVTMLVKTFKLTSDNAENTFSDVSEDDWYNEYVNIAVGNGIISGMSDDYFGADEKITRQDITVMGMRLWNALNKEMAGRYRAEFTDLDEVSEYALDSVTAMAEAGVVNGFETGGFAPLANATRAEAAVIIYRMAVKYDE